MVKRQDAYLKPDALYLIEGDAYSGRHLFKNKLVST